MFTGNSKESMKFKMAFAVPLLVVMILSAAVASAQEIPEKGYKCVTEERARNIVGFLADDLLEGREAGTRGGYLAAEYIIAMFREWGMAPLLDEGYCQQFTAVKNGNNWVSDADTDISGFLSQGCASRTLKNILVVIPGKEDGVVVVGAHYDHLGIGKALDGDSCYNGADDNASGVSAVMQIAKAIKESGKKPRRTILFALWDGEEMGLLGSTYFVKKCPFLSDISAYMNFDMVGRGPLDNPRHLSYLYTAGNPAFADWMREDTEERGFCFDVKYTPSENLIGGSDNSPFARKGIPIVWYHTEGHPDYHRPSDSSGSIDYPKLTDITRAALLCVWRLANEEY